jgi:hypothetical protein
MAALIFLALNLAASLFKPRWRLEAENAALRQQLIVLQRKVPSRVEFTNSDRLFFIQLYRWFPSILKATTIIRPEVVVRWQGESLGIEILQAAAVARALAALGDRPAASQPWSAAVSASVGSARASDTGSRR